MQQYIYYATVLGCSRSVSYSTKEEALDWAHRRLAHGARHVNIFLQVGGVDYLLETIRQSTATTDTYNATVVQGNEASLVGASTRTEATQWGLDRRVFDGAKVVDIYLEIEGKSYFIDRLLDPKVWRYQAMVEDGGNLALADTSPQCLAPEEAIEWGEAKIAEGVKRVIVYLLKEDRMVEHTILVSRCT